MLERQTETLVRQLRRLLEPHAARDLDDAELLRLFADSRDEQAFAALVHKHGGMVWSVCRRVLQHEQDAEDAFQGTFLVLARKARSIRKKKSVSSWLYGVAQRVARKARVAAARRRRREQQAPATVPANPAVELAWRELQTMLDEELCRLPEKWRAPFVLCCLKGQTKKEAARELGWKEGTVSSRLAHARKRLQERLGRRGVSLSAVLCGMALGVSTSSAAIPPALAALTIKASLAFAAGTALAAGGNGAAGELAQAVLQAMAAVRMKLAGIVVLLASAVGLGVTLGFSEPAADRKALARPDGPRDRQPRSELAARIAVPKNRSTDTTGTMTVSGRVTGRDGQPITGAQVAMVAGEFRKSGRKVLRSGQTDAQGRFLLSLARPEGGRDYGVSLVTSAPGYAPSWHAVSPRQEHHDIPCALDPGQVARGRLVDERGAPVAGVKVHVLGLVNRKAGSSVMRFRNPPDQLAAWPAPVLTDAAGEFLLRDVGENWELDLQVRDERFAPQWLVLRTGSKRPESATFKLEPRRTIKGTITCADTGLPMPHAQLAVISFGPGASAGLLSKSEGQADAQGRFRLVPFPGKDLVLTAAPPAGTTYLGLRKPVAWSAGTRYREVNLALPRGVLIHGRAVEGPSEIPVNGATIEYRPRFNDNPHVRAEGPAIDWGGQDTQSGPDGAFQLPVLPGPGWLLVRGPSAEYIHVEIGEAQIQGAKAGGTPCFPDAVIPLAPKPGAGTLEVRAVLRRGVTVRGEVFGHDGLPASAAFLMAPTFVPHDFYFRGEVLAARDGRFELPGCAPDKTVQVLFFDTARQEGAVAEISARNPAPYVIRLAPCGSVTTRFVDSLGRPVARRVQLDVLLRPGATIQESFDRQIPAHVTVPAGRFFGPHCMRLDPMTGAATFDCLIPGATYLVQADEGAGIVQKTRFTVQPGERAKLPDIVLKP